MRTWLDDILKRQEDLPPFDVPIYSNPGERVEPDYKVHYSKTGVRSLEKDGSRNTWEEIQSYKDSVDINIIIQKYVNGDESVLHKNDGFYIDVKDLPKTPGEWFELMSRANDAFLQMSPELRDQYNHSVEQFVQSKVEEGKDSKVDET